MWRGVVVAGGVCLGATVAAAQPPGPEAALTLERAVADAAAGTLTVSGARFGSRPLVTLDLVPLALKQASDSELVAAVPLDLMPPGRYLLTVSRGPADGDTASMHVALGGEPAAGDTGVPPGTAEPDAASRGPGPLPSGADPAATVGDRAISVEQADREWQRTDPAGYLAASRRLYEARHRAVQTLVSNELLAREAAERGLTTQALLDEELPRRVVPMPDVAVTALYQSLGDRARGATLDEMQPALRAWLARVTEPELARMSYVEELMKVSTRSEIHLRAPRVEVAPAPTDASVGPDAAPVQLVIFGDFESAEYTRLARAFPRVRETFGSRLRLVFRHLPLRGLLSETAARAAECARRQDRFWPFHDAVVTSPGFLDTPRLKRIAAEAGLARPAFDTCLDQNQSRAVVVRAPADAARYAVTASPSLLVNGALAPPPPAFLPPFEYLQRLVEEELARLAATPR